MQPDSRGAKKKERKTGSAQGLGGLGEDLLASSTALAICLHLVPGVRAFRLINI